MATWSTSNAVGEREDLSDVITRIDPDETPIYSNLPKTTSSAILTEWQTQELATASATNAASEGADASYVNPQATTRLGNYHQISVKAAQVSGTVDAVDKAGRDRETAYVKVLKSLELRRDLEATITADQAKSSGSPRKVGTLSSWITNVSVDSGGSGPTGDGSDVPTSGSSRALSLDMIDDAMQAAFIDGGQPNMMTVSPVNKKNFSDLQSSTTGNFVMQNQYNTTSPSEAVMIGSVSMYLSDYGRLDVTIDRFQGDDRIFLLDTDFAQVCTLPGRNFFTENLAKTGDSEKFQIICEWSMIVNAPKAHGAVYDLSGS